MRPQDVVVIGGGIAGVSAACGLARSGASVRLIEQEALLATHSSGRNAALFRQLEQRQAEIQLATNTRTLLDRLVPGWLRSIGYVFVAAEEMPIAALEQRCRAEGVPARRVDGSRLTELAPALQGGSARFGLLCPEDGVIDTNRVCEELWKAARDRGAKLLANCRAQRIEVVSGRVTGVVLANGERLAAEMVVIAGGGWAGAMGATAGAPLALTPYRRHLAVLDVPLPSEHPAVLRCGDETYFRPESGGALASPCDETPWPAEIPPTDEAVLADLARKLSELAPSLAQSGVRTAWAGLRTFASDRGSVVGGDKRVDGLWWLAGLGGHGMTCGPAAGQVLATLMHGGEEPLSGVLSPNRFLSGTA